MPMTCHLISLVFALGAQATVATPQAAAVPVSEAGYRIGAGDVLHVFVWKEPEISGPVVVRLDGRITVPLLGDVQAAGKRPEDLAVEVSTALRDYLDSPHVTISVQEANSARFFVVGQVEEPGAFAFTGPLSVVQALALAGGFREFAKRDSIIVIREQNGSRQVLEFDYEELERGKGLDQNHALQVGDTILVP